MLKNISAGSGIGLIVGILLVAWVRPDSSGTAFLIVISILVMGAIGSLFSAVKETKNTKVPRKIRNEP
ncbi:hypothetical protein [Rhizobium lusitanum]|uniref:hypothetical protein n=1 Tax=Rhizobium lusitanum TaxID=293958 RepID=UPI00195E2E77|nr:hypothetical protein [Rhizobium lusitanum]MBM7050169.1 hypothetical protein [Rhizobium lusitanum]